MTKPSHHGFDLNQSPQETARTDYMSSLRAFVLTDMAGDMRSLYEDAVKPAFEKQTGVAPKDGDDVHKAMSGLNTFKAYSAARVNAQELVWESVEDAVARQAEDFNGKVQDAAANGGAGGSVTLDDTFQVPRSVSAIDVHLMPGSYTGTKDKNDVSSAALYDHGLRVFSFGLMGENLNDIGTSISKFIGHRYPDFRPAKILDLGCTVGHNTMPWKRQYPEAEVHAIDAAGPGLLYGHAQAEAQGLGVHFRQMSSDALDFEDDSFDLVFSSMFLHEISRKTIDKTMAEAYRVLRPGGLMLHMELPPNNQCDAYDAFYLDWDNYYNMEPFYKAFRDQDPKEVCVRSGFSEDKFVQFIIPSLNGYGEDAIREAAQHQGKVGHDTGIFAEGIQWFTFGAWK